MLCPDYHLWVAVSCWTRNAPTYVTNNELEQFSSVLRKQALVTLRSLATRPALKACVFKQSRVLQFFFFTSVRRATPILVLLTPVHSLL